jgi:O-methyltransferase
VLVHTTLAREIMSVPPEVPGAVIECGSWKGASAASLSLVCQLVGRRLLVCDSFQGLPDGSLELYAVPHGGTFGYLKGGMFSGSLEEVRGNVRDYGAVEACEFVPGFFADTLPRLAGPLVCAFLDVDRVSSNQECLRAIWPLLAEGCALYTDDAGNMEVAKLFFDDAWWRDNVGCPAPGLIGAGSGLPITPVWSPLGYARKVSSFDPSGLRRVPFLFYPS